MKHALRWFVAGMAMALASPAFAADGKAVFDAKCASCHGPDGKGNEKKEKVLKLEPGTLNLGRDAVASQTADQKKEIIAKGEKKMPAYGSKLSAEEVDAVTGHVMELVKAIRGK